jgi:hypothetical protein
MPNTSALFLAITVAIAAAFAVLFARDLANLMRYGGPTPTLHGYYARPGMPGVIAITREPHARVSIARIPSGVPAR